MEDFISAENGLKPEEILALWEKTNFTLSDLLREQFLKHQAMSELTKFKPALVSAAICEKRIKKLDQLLQFLKTVDQNNQIVHKPRFRLARQYFRDALPPLGDYFGDGSDRIYGYSGPTLEFEYEEKDFPEGEVIEYQKKSREGSICHLCGGLVEKNRCNCSHT